MSFKGGTDCGIDGEKCSKAGEHSTWYKRNIRKRMEILKGTSKRYLYSSSESSINESVESLNLNIRLLYLVCYFSRMSSMLLLQPR